MHYTLLIISTTIQSNIIKDSYELEYKIFDSAHLIDNNSIKVNDEIYYFDYLIIDDLSLITNIKIKLEHKKAITNFYLETSIENIFAIGNANNSTNEETGELNKVLDYIKYGE